MRDSYWESMIAENPTKGRGANDLKFECPLFYMVVCSGENTMGYIHVGLGMVSGSLYYVWWFLWGFYHPFREALISLFICINSQSYLNQFAHLLFCFFLFFFFFLILTKKLYNDIKIETHEVDCTSILFSSQFFSGYSSWDQIENFKLINHLRIWVAFLFSNLKVQ